MHRITTNSLFLVLLIAASLWAMALSASLADTPAIGTSAPSNVSTVRAYYAAVRDYFESGDLAGVRAVVDPSVLTNKTSNDASTDLSMHLRGLRETWPDLTFAIEELTGSGDAVVARVLVDHVANADAPVSPLAKAPARQQIETFRIAGDRIVEWWSTAARHGTFVSSVGIDNGLEIQGSRSLALARISFAAGKTGRVAFQASTLLLVEQGSVRFRGDGLTNLATFENPEGTVTSAGADVTAFPGDSILIPRGPVVLHAGTARPVSLLAVMLIPSHSPPPDHEIHTTYPSPEDLLTYKQSGQIGQGISIELIDRANGSNTGLLQLVAGVAVLEPGIGMELERGLEQILIVPQSGSVSQISDPVAQRQLLINDGTTPATVFIAAVRPLSTA